MGKAYDDWCEKEKNNYLAKYHVESKSIALQLFANLDKISEL